MSTPEHVTPAAPLVLHQFRPAWGLQAYMRFANITYHVVNSRYPVYSSTGPLPQLQHGKALVGWRKSIRYLKKLSGKDLDADLHPVDAADVVAFCTMLETTLEDVLLYSYWADNKRYDTHTRPVMSKTMVAPLRWFVPDTLRKRYVGYLSQQGMADSLSVRHAAMACYRALDTKLGSKPFLFGDRPTSADALLYGHLAAAQFEACEPWLAKFANLKRFHKAVAQRYFGDVTSNVGYLCTQGVNHFEAEANKLRKKRAAARAGKGDSSAATWWRYGVIAMAATVVGTSLIVSARRGGKSK